MSGGTPPVTGRSPSTTRPWDNGMSPAISPSSVVLPHPDGPTRLTKRPAATRKLTSSTAVNSPAGVSNVRVTRSTTIIGSSLARLWVGDDSRSEEHTSELQSLAYLVCRLLLEKKK